MAYYLALGWILSALMMTLFIMRAPTIEDEDFN